MVGGGGAGRDALLSSKRRARSSAGQSPPPGPPRRRRPGALTRRTEPTVSPGHRRRSSRLAVREPPRPERLAVTHMQVRSVHTVALLAATYSWTSGAAAASPSSGGLGPLPPGAAQPRRRCWVTPRSKERGLLTSKLGLMVVGWWGGGVDVEEEKVMEPS